MSRRTHDDVERLPAVTVALLTYQRTEGLEGTLEMLCSHVADSRLDASVLVVDNDETPSGSPIVARFADRRVRYVHEPTPGIPAARNRALDETETRLLVFIDDDEHPTSGWLRSLVEMWVANRPAGVVGPVVSTFDGPIDPWIEAGRFFERLRHPTGTPVEVAATNNLLLDLDYVGQHHFRFDPRFTASGGSDTVFTRAVVASGGTLLWCDEAIVIDRVPETRATRRWVLQRAARLGNSASRAALVAQTSWGRRTITRVRLSGAGASRLVVGGLRVVAGRMVRSMRHEARGSRTWARGRGMLGGAWGTVVEEYHRVSAGTAP